MKEYVMGNGAIAYGALKAGVNLVSGYPGTPSSEIVETVAKAKPEGVHVEWSVNEKAAMEVAAAAAYSGARTLVTMKQVGLNVASDPLMSLAYVGVKGGMVVVSADDPGPISSQTEQDTRRFAEFARIPVFDPSSPEEAYVREFGEKPVVVRLDRLDARLLEHDLGDPHAVGRRVVAPFQVAFRAEEPRHEESGQLCEEFGGEMFAHGSFSA